MDIKSINHYLPDFVWVMRDTSLPPSFKSAEFIFS